MLTQIGGLAVTPLAVAAAAGGTSVTAQKLGKFVMQTQKQPQWCWAAVSTSTGLFFGTGTWTQCAVATAGLWFMRVPNCCASPLPRNCNSPNNLEEGLRVTKSLDRDQNGTLPASDIQTQINDKKPVCALILWTTGGGHYVAFTGYSYPSNNQSAFSVLIQDSYFGQTTMLLADFPAKYHQGGRWQRTYLTIKGGTGK